MTIQLLFFITFFAIAHGVIKKIDTQIVGGRLATPGEIPYQASLQRIRTEEHFCGGVILSQYYVLTAAHCVDGVDVNTISVNVGLIDLREQHAVHLIESSYIHEDYNLYGQWINDIAVLKLQSPIKYSRLASPIVLTKNLTTPGTEVVVSGFGRLSFEGEKTTRLYVANVEIVDQTDCRDVWRQFRNIYDTQICANDETEEKGLCEYDSGGPLVTPDEMQMLIGIGSFGYKCGDTTYPAVYTYVPKYFQWVLDHTED